MHGDPLHVYVNSAPLKVTVVFTFVLNPVHVSVLPNHIPSLLATVFDPHENVSGDPKDIKSAIAVEVHVKATTIAAASMRKERRRMGGSPRQKKSNVYFSVRNLPQTMAESRFKSQEWIFCAAKAFL
jgi:hypothetical protein